MDEYERYKRAQAERWLKHVLKLGDRCRALKLEIDEQRKLASGLSGIDYSSPAVRSGKTQDAVPDAVSRLLDSIRDYCTELASYVGEQKDAHDALSKMADAVEAECLTRRYVLGQPWERACVDMRYSYDGMMSLRRRALLHAYEVMPLEWRDPMHPAV